MAAEIASRLDATAVLAAESGSLVLARRKGAFHLYSWFPQCGDESVLASLRDPCDISDDHIVLD